MTKVSVRKGKDWVEVYVNGEMKVMGHSFSIEDMFTVLRGIPAVETERQEGTFCEDCRGWTTRTVMVRRGEFCPDCAEEQRKA